jgi:hypothetical protein
MTTKLIAALAIALAIFGGWGLYKYWETFENNKQAEIKAAAAKAVVPEQLPGLPYELQPSLEAAQKQGPSAFQAWLRTHSRALQDPRKAWIELDYCVMVSRNNPAEARRVFEAVKQRTTPASPVWPRIQDLQKTYE